MKSILNYEGKVDKALKNSTEVNRENTENHPDNYRDGPLCSSAVLCGLLIQFLFKI